MYNELPAPLLIVSPYGGAVGRERRNNPVIIHGKQKPLNNAHYEVLKNLNPILDRRISVLRPLSRSGDPPPLLYLSLVRLIS